MALTIKQGDAYSIPVSATLNGSALNLADVLMIEFTFGDGDGTVYTRKLYPDVVTTQTIDGSLFLMVPLTQEETFAFPIGAVGLDERVYFVGGDVKGVAKPQWITVVDAFSEEVL